MSKPLMMMLSIGEAAAASGLSADTLRYYEKLGLVERIPRASSSGHRVYRAEDLEWLRFLQRLRGTGMPIAAMRRYAELRRQGPASSAARRALLEAHAAGVAAEIERLQGLLNGLHEKIALYRTLEQAPEGMVMANPATAEKASSHDDPADPLPSSGHPRRPAPARRGKAA